MSSAIDQTTHAHDSGHNHDAAAKAKNQTDTASAAEAFSKLLDGFRARGLVEINGGDGDDLINADGWHVRVSGGAGNDTINATGYDVRVDGGAGDDVINAQSTAPYCGPHLHGWCGFLIHPPHLHHHGIPAVRTEGGDGNDTINSLGFSNAQGGAGDDVIHIGGGIAFGGSGDDTLTNNGGSAQLHGGAGNDTIVSRGTININSTVSGGSGDDTIYASGSRIWAMGGTGNDSITLDGSDDRGVVFMDRHGHIGRNYDLLSTVDGGIGDDTISLVKDARANITYFAGDGHDTLEGANEISTLRFGPGLTFEAATFSTAGKDLTIAFADADGSVTIKNYAESGVPMVAFADGRTLDASTTIAYAGGNPGGYVADDGSSSPAEAKAEADAKESKGKSNETSHDDD